MDLTIEEFGKLYPAYATSYFKDECEIVETAPKSELDFRRLVVSGGDGYAFPRELAADSVSFYSKAGCKDPMLLNSDGVFFSEVDGRKCLFICELKSSFGVTQISHAKEQIVGTLLSLKAQLGILQTLPDWEYHGVIVSYEPTDNQLVYASKLTSRDASFSRYLCAKKHKQISSSIANNFYAPLALPDITIHYVAVPDRKNEFQVDLRELLNL